MSNIPTRAVIAFFIGIVLLQASPVLAQSSSAQITGTLAYPERMALPADAVINIQLQDVSIADVAAQVIAETMINAEGRQVPVPFTLAYDPAKIDPSHRYSVRATIRSGDGMLMFTTAQTYPVITHGAPSKVSLMLRTVGRGPKPGTTAQKSSQHKPAPVPATAEKQSASEATPAANATPEVTPGSAATQPPAAQTATEKSETTEERKPASEPERSGVSVGQSAKEPPSATSDQSTAPAATAGEPAQSGAAERTAVTEQPPAAPATPMKPSGVASAPGTSSDEGRVQPNPPLNNVERPEGLVAPKPSQPESKAAEAQSAPSEKTQAGSEPVLAQQPEPKQAETQPATADAQPSTQAAKPAEQPEKLPDSPSTVAGLTQPAAAPEPEPELVPARPKADTPLADTQWKLVQLGGVPVVIEPLSHPMTLAFSPEGRRIAGSAGCHSYIGSFTDDHGKLSLKPGDLVTMGCPANIIKREQKFIAAMRDTDAYRVTGDYLVLSSKGKTVAKFKNQLAP